MSTSPITFDHLLALARAGYTLQLTEKHLIVKNVPYVDNKLAVCTADLICVLYYGGTELVAPQRHTVWWTGTVPHQADGVAMDWMCVNQRQRELDEGLSVTMQLSQKWRHKDGKRRDYSDYNEQITTYLHIIRRHADAVSSQ